MHIVSSYSLRLTAHSNRYWLLKLYWNNKFCRSSSELFNL